MPFSHVTGAYNVEATLRNWLFAQITANRPPLIASVNVQWDYPEKPAVPPCWSIVFLGVTPGQEWQGSHTSSTERGRMQHGLLEVSAWVSRRTVGWRGQLAQMVDAVTKAVISVQQYGGAVIVKDFYTDVNTPAPVAYRIVIEGAEVRTPPTDPNPDIERRRVLISYFWVERA